MDDSQLSAAFDAAAIPGAVALLVDRDGVRYARAFGQANAATQAPMTVGTVCQIASMTKALVSVAGMQLVEQGRLSLDAPIGAVLPDLAAPQVLTGFDDAGRPVLRPAARPITLRHLLTHTAGFGYSFVHPEVLSYFTATGMPAPGSRGFITMPLMFDPGERWEYSVATDWVGLAIEAVTGETLGDYLARHVFAPLGMKDTAFRPALPADAARVHARNANGGFDALEINLGGGEFHSGGGGLSGTAPDYARFVITMLRGGEIDGQRILAEETVAEMCRNQVAPLRAGYMGTSMPEISAPFDTFPDQHTGWGLGFLINPEPGPNGRSTGSCAWAGIFNSYYWFDRKKGVGGVVMSQLSPFGDSGVLEFYGALERMAYA